MQLIFRLIDNTSERIGQAISWLLLFMVIIQLIVVLQRYVFGVGSILMQESITYMHGSLFMLAAAYTWLHNGHVRVDIFYRPASERTKAWTNLLGTLFFVIPTCVLIIWASWPDVALSWRVGEGSTESSGIQYKYLLKSCLLALPTLLIVQGISVICKTLLELTGKTVDDPYYDPEGSH